MITNSPALYLTEIYVSNLLNCFLNACGKYLFYYNKESYLHPKKQIYSRIVGYFCKFRSVECAQKWCIEC